MSADTSQAERFFSTLYAGQSGVLELRTFGPELSDTSALAKRQRARASDLRDFVPVVDGVVSNYAAVAKYLDGCAAAQLGAFFGVALRTESAAVDKKGDAAHLHTLTALFVDADFKHLGEPETRRRIAAFALPPTCVVESGGGLHPYWKLAVPITLTRDFDLARRWLRHLAAAVADIVDEKVSEPARVLRIPGSFNFKKIYGTPQPVVLA